MPKKNNSHRRAPSAELRLKMWEGVLGETDCPEEVMLRELLHYALIDCGNDSDPNTKMAAYRWFVMEDHEKPWTFSWVARAIGFNVEWFIREHADVITQPDGEYAKAYRAHRNMMHRRRSRKSRLKAGMVPRYHRQIADGGENSLDSEAERSYVTRETGGME